MFNLLLIIVCCWSGLNAYELVESKENALHKNKFLFNFKSPNTTPDSVQLKTPTKSSFHTSNKAEFITNNVIITQPKSTPTISPINDLIFGNRVKAWSWFDATKPSNLKKVRNPDKVITKSFMNSKHLTKNLFNLCWSSPCLNGASCYGSSSSYYCKCKDNYTGINCETELAPGSTPKKLCNNAICNNKGVCQVLEDTTKVCDCFKPFYGFNCEHEYVTKLPEKINIFTKNFTNKFLSKYKSFPNPTKPNLRG